MNTKAEEELQTSDFTRTKFELRISDLWLQTQLWHFAVPHTVMFRLLGKVMPSWIHFLVQWKSLTNVYFSYTDFLYLPFKVVCFSNGVNLDLYTRKLCRDSDFRGFYCFPTLPRCRFCRLMKSRNRRYLDGLKWSGTYLENRDSFYFPDASQMSAMVGDRSRQMKTQICTVGDVSDPRSPGIFPTYENQALDFRLKTSDFKPTELALRTQHFRISDTSPSWSRLSLASHADVLRGSSRVPAPRTSAELKDKFLSHCSQISAGDHMQIIGDPIGAVEVKVLTSQTHTHKLCRVWYVNKDFCSWREYRR